MTQIIPEKNMALNPSLGNPIQDVPHGGKPSCPALSIVIPVYGDGGSLSELAARLAKVFSPETGYAWELILVNDGSPESCWGVICRLAEEYPNVRGIDLMRNYGQHNAVLCGIREAVHPVIVTMDDDLQHPPEQIPALLEELATGCDVVYGYPKRQRHGLLRSAATFLTKLALRNVTGIEVAGTVGPFRAFRTRLREAFRGYENPFVSVDVLLAWATRRFAAVCVQHDPRRIGQSQYTFGKLAVHALNLMTGFSTLPLQCASLMGLLFTLFGLIVLVIVLADYFRHGRMVPGFAFLASIIAIFSGAQLFALGIIGEYLARVHSRSMDRPPYAVRRTTESPIDPAQ